MPDLIPLDKLISRLRTDLKLSKKYSDTYGESNSNDVIRKNKMKASILYYLESLKERC